VELELDWGEDVSLNDEDIGEKRLQRAGDVRGPTPPGSFVVIKAALEPRLLVVSEPVRVGTV
jgi:hypothetical protein